MNVLLVDDNETIHIVMNEVLAVCLPHVRLSSVYNGRDGVAMAIEPAVSLLLLDLDMPIMNGRDAYAHPGRPAAAPHSHL